jgi:hypothetical protein
LQQPAFCVAAQHVSCFTGEQQDDARAVCVSFVCSLPLTASLDSLPVERLDGVVIDISLESAIGTQSGDDAQSKRTHAVPHD